jgi:two-component system chemotaxis sensor kinase CheA
MIEADAELLAEFVVESQERLADIENQLLAIEQAGEAIDLELVNGVFRAMHSIKGAAGFLGLGKIGGLAHAAEEVLDRIRNRELTPTSEVVSRILRSADLVLQMLSDIHGSENANVAPAIVALAGLPDRRSHPGYPPST